jgi:hypothetical protein
MAVELHLVRCRSCRSALEGLDGLGQALRIVEVPPVPSSLTWQIMAKAREHQAAGMGGNVIRFGRGFPALRIWAFRGAAAAVLAFGLAIGSYMGWSAGGPATQAGTARSDSLHVYDLDYLGGVPDGSLADSYLALASDRNGEGYRRW